MLQNARWNAQNGAENIYFVLVGDAK